MFRLRPLTIALAAAVVVAWPAPAWSAATRYRIDFIDPPATPVPAQYLNAVVGFNNHGDVAFTYNRTVEAEGYLLGIWDSFVATQSGVRRIPHIGGEGVFAYDLTDAGLVVGTAVSPDTYYSTKFGHHYHYNDSFLSQAGNSAAIATPDRGYSFASAANNQGVVIGLTPSAHVFQWSESAGLVDLGDFGGEYVQPVDINERGEILLTVHSHDVLQYGGTYDYNGRDVVIFRDGIVSPLPRSPFGITFASAINDHGAVVGSFASIPGVQSHAFIWDEVNGLRDLGRDAEDSFAIDINNSGVVIGASSHYAPHTPFVYTEADGRRSLSELIVNLSPGTSLESAARINDRGQIAGIAIMGNGDWNRRVYIATPIPEPSTWAIAALATLCVASWRRAKRLPSKVA